MCAQTIVLTDAAPVGEVISEDLFAANVIFTFNYLDSGGAFDRMLNEMGWTGIRFPGGTVTEDMFAPGSDFVERFFDVTRPSGVATDGSDRIVTTPAAFEYAAENDLTFHYTLPSKQYLSDLVDEDGNRMSSQFGLYRLLDRVDTMIRGEYGEITITSFEIGNEFWGSDNKLEPDEYGPLVDQLSIGMQALFDVYQDERGGPEYWQQPLIAAQSAPGWLPGANEEIFEHLSLASRQAIDAVITHYYPTTYVSAGSRQAHFDRLDEWQNLEGVNKELEYFVSEWNMQNGSDTGLVQASGMLEIMRTMIERGVDYAAIWGTQYLKLGSRLAVLENDPDAPGGREYTLTAAGEMYRMMAHDLPGLQLLELDTAPELRSALDVPQDERTPEQAEQLVMHAYGNADTTIVYISSRSDIPIDVTVDPAALVPGYHHLWAEVLGVIDDPSTPNVDESDITSRLAEPYIQTLNSSELMESGSISVTLQPYEIIRLEFTSGDDGVEMTGHDYVVDPSADYDDDLRGSRNDDTIIGYAGDDSLRGYAGNDIISGGDGNDFLGGWTGNDLMASGDGNDTLLGGAGNDTLIAESGTNILQGDAGVDQFIVDPSGQTQITDFDIDSGEGLSFLDAYDTADDVISRASTDNEDLVISHDDGGETRLVGLADRIDDLDSALTDFQPNSPVSDIVDAINTPPPDGSIEPDPPPEPEPATEEAFTRDDLTELLQLESPEEVAAFIQGLTAEEQNAMVDMINPNALALAASPQLWGAFCDNLDDENFREFIDAIDPDILDMRYARITAEEFANGPDNLMDIDSLPLCRTFPEVSDEIRIDYYLGLSEDERGQIEQIWADRHPDSPGLTAAEIFRIDPSAIEDRREELATTDEQPEFAKFLQPSAYNKSYLSDADADEEEYPPPDEDDERPVIAGGGGCFIATCAYGNYDHPDVMFLRLYRDLELAEHEAGRRFIRFYYRFGPWLAAAIEPFPPLKAGIRALPSRLVRRMHANRAMMGRQRP